MEVKISIMLTDIHAPAQTLYAAIQTNSRIVSFWDMLQLDQRSLLSAISFLAATAGEFNILLQIEVGQTQAISKKSQETKVQTLKSIEVIRDFAVSQEMTTSAKVAQRAFDACLNVLANPGPIYAHELIQPKSRIEHLLEVFVDEAASRKFFAMAGSMEIYHQSADELFGADVVDAFPSTIYDIEEAGKCLSFEIYTATVMHTMRILEVGLGHLAQQVGAESAENWNRTLNNIEASLRQVSKKIEGEDAEQWAAEAGTHLRFIKNAWRNQAMHPLTTYDERQARQIFGDAQIFMRHLAQKRVPASP